MKFIFKKIRKIKKHCSILLNRLNRFVRTQLNFTNLIIDGQQGFT